MALKIAHHGIAKYAFTAPSEPRSVVPGMIGTGVGVAEQLLEKDLKIAVDRHIRLHGGFEEFSRVDIHLDLEGAAGKRLPVVTGLADVET